MRPISLVIVFVDTHSAGERHETLRATVERVVRPLCGALEAFPQVSANLALSGSLLDWLELEDMQTIERIAALVAKKQVEVLAVPHYGCPIHLVPSRDAVDQIHRNVQ